MMKKEPNYLTRWRVLALLLAVPLLITDEVIWPNGTLFYGLFLGAIAITTLAELVGRYVRFLRSDW